MMVKSALLEDSAAPMEMIAIVGMAGRFPDAPDLATFWRNLEAGHEAVRIWKPEELEARGVPSSLVHDSRYVRAGIVLDGMDLFDAEFFNMSSAEAEIMDPQQRVLLECAWAAMEDAGHAPSRIEGPVAVYVGKSASGYLVHQLARNPNCLLERGIESLSDLQVAIGNDKDYAATLISYKLNLQGPSVSVQTACSSSLVAVHLACQDLLAHRCDMALAGGASLNLKADQGYLYREGSILSPDGHCHVFDERAQGTVKGSGAGVVVLRRLSEALAEGDRIYAVIRGSAINNDGSQKVGYAAPSIQGQRDVILQAMEFAEVSAESIGLVEAHGTGTLLGDPIEIAALEEAYRTHTSQKGYCAVGSVKANIGHLDVAAGVAGLIKATLALHHRKIPPLPAFGKSNPAINFRESPFYPATELRPWEPSHQTAKRRAAVSSFGIGGTNAHLILEEAPAPAIQDASMPERDTHLLVVSARTDSAAAEIQKRLIGQLNNGASADASALAALLQRGRTHFTHRRAFLAEPGLEGPPRLEELPPPKMQMGSTPSIVFMFPGQGAQHTGMARGLLTNPTFRREFGHCAAILQPLIGLDLHEMLAPNIQPEAINRTEIAQPLLFAIEYSLAKLWIKWGIQPHAMIGHSIGEYVAACLAGVMSLEDALRIVASRGRLMSSTAPGAMLAVHASADAMKLRLSDGLALAAVNGPDATVVAGKRDVLERLRSTLAQEAVGSTFLQTARAFHSPDMDPILDTFSCAFEKVELAAPRIPFISNVTGTFIHSREATNPDYWAQHIRSTVRFGDGLDTLAAEPNLLLLEVGPGCTLQTLALRHPVSQTHPAIASMRHPHSHQSDWACLLRALGELWMRGVSVAWEAVGGPDRFRGVQAPAYPFERQRYWIDAADQAPPSWPTGVTERLSEKTASEATACKTGAPKNLEPATPSSRDATALASMKTALLGTVVNEVSSIWCRLLGLAKLDFDADVRQFGADSLLLMQFRSRIRQAFGVAIPIAVLNAQPTTANCSEYVVKTLLDEADPATLDGLLGQHDASSQAAANHN